MSASKHTIPAQSKKRQRKLVERRRRRIAYRLRDRKWPEQARPMMRASNIHYEVADKDRGLGEGGIAAIHLLAQRVGLVKRIDDNLHLLKRHLPYHESDHVLNIAYNVLSGGTCLDDLELRRNDEVYLDALGAQRIPDPTTAGDFCRRFTAEDLDTLTDAINQTRVQVWRQQDPPVIAPLSETPLAKKANWIRGTRREAPSRALRGKTEKPRKTPPEEKTGRDLPRNRR